MNTGTAPNAQRLLWAGFFCIFASGVGFGVRAAVLVAWAKDYGFTQAELGDISGGGLWGLGVIIILGSLIADRIGYGRLMILAFLMHLLSAAMQLSTDVVFREFGDRGREAVFWNLYIAMFLFAIGNGICEVVVNPMVAALFPNEKTHYLNILHAGWPGGLIAGGVVGYVCSDLIKAHWMMQMSMFLVPVAIYGLMMVGQHFPRSEASQSGVSYAEMLLEFTSPILLLLLFIHGLVGYVELGTDSWIGKITGSIMNNRGYGLLLFIYTSGLMFILRFFAGPIEHRLSPLGLLCLSGVLGAIGLTLLGNAEGIAICVVAATVYACGKTFLWPTMLAVVSERFPKGGAITMGAVGGVGMLSAGLLGSPGIGFKQDYYATHELKQKAPATYERYVAETPKSFYGLAHTAGLNGTKVSLLELDHTAKKGGDEGKLAEHDLDLTLGKLQAEKSPLVSWWDTEKQYADKDFKPIAEANDFGGRMALQWTAIVPATMAVLYLLLMLYFRMTGGYKRVVIEPGPASSPHREHEVPVHSA
jgi:MFS family permease